MVNPVQQRFLAPAIAGQPQVVPALG
jgi:hypothetical protein